MVENRLLWRSIIFYLGGQILRYVPFVLLINEWSNRIKQKYNEWSNKRPLIKTTLWQWKRPQKCSRVFLCSTSTQRLVDNMLYPRWSTWYFFEISRHASFCYSFFVNDTSLNKAWRVICERVVAKLSVLWETVVGWLSRRWRAAPLLDLAFNDLVCFISRVISIISSPVIVLLRF